MVWVHGGPTGQVSARTRPGEGVLHQPWHRDHRRELRRLDRLRPPVPRAAAPRSGASWTCEDADRRRAVRWPKAEDGGPGPAGHPRRLGRRLDRAGRRHDRHGRTGRCSAPRRPTSASPTCAASPDHARLRVALPGRSDRPAARLRGRVRGARARRARERAAPARSCCCRAWTIRSSRRPVGEHRRRPGRARHPATPTWRSRASRTASARRESIIASLEAELSFYGQILGFTPPGVPAVSITGRSRASARAARSQGQRATERTRWRATRGPP